MKPARAIAFGLLALAAIAGAVIASRQHREAEITAPATSTDPLGAELVRCRDQGAAAVKDITCREAWAKNRARFFGWQKPE